MTQPLLRKILRERGPLTVRELLEEGLYSTRPNLLRALHQMPDSKVVGVRPAGRNHVANLWGVDPDYVPPKRYPHEEIRALLTEHEDGLTPGQIGRLMGAPAKTVRNLLATMKGVYVDRWVKNDNNWALASVWCIGDFEDCPRPPKKGEA